MKLIFSGIQWCGKGTQARLLVEKYGFTHLEMGGEFRKVVASGTELGNKIKAVIDAWYQVDEDLWKQVMEQVVLEYKDTERVIFDGFIRNTWNKEIFDRLLPDYKVVVFELPIEEAKRRLLWRMYDPSTWETFPSDITHNPKTGTTLIKRNDDKDEEAILTRLDEFEKKTLPILEIQKSENKVIAIDANQSIEDVFQDLITSLSL